MDPSPASPPSLARAAVGAVLVLVLSLACVYAASAWRVLSAARAPAPQITPSHALVVLGAALDRGQPTPDFHARLQRARQVLASSPSHALVLSGGKPVGGMSEAARAAQALVEWGIHPMAGWVLEEHSTHTFDNLAFSSRILAGRPMAVVSNRYHLARVGRIARQMGLDVALVPAEDAWSWSWSNVRAAAREAAFHTAMTLGYRPAGYPA